MMNSKGCGRKRSWPNLMPYAGTCFEKRRKTTKKLSQYSQCPGRDLKPGPPGKIGFEDGSLMEPA
jgi:hypothetical protein